MKTVCVQEIFPDSNIECENVPVCSLCGVVITKPEENKYIEVKGNAVCFDCLEIINKQQKNKLIERKENIQTFMLNEIRLVSIKNGIVYISEYDVNKGWITWKDFDLYKAIEKVEVEKNE